MPSERGHLPHIDHPDLAQFITLRLADAIPPPLRAETRSLDPNSIELSPRLMEEALDKGYGACLLQKPIVAGCVESILIASSATEFELHAWVLMPNHAHLLLQPRGSYKIGQIMQRFKSRSTVEVNRLLSRSGQLWQRNYFDRYIRNADHFDRAVNYIHGNPVGAGLVASIDAWRWSSAWADRLRQWERAD